MKSDFKFHYKLRVRFSETDLQGIVFNGNYLTYYDVAWTEYFRALGLEYPDFGGFGADMVLARTEIDFKSPARFDQVLAIYTRVLGIGNKSMTIDFEIYPDGEDRLISSAHSIYVCIHPQTQEAVRVPDGFRTRISEFESKAF